MFFVVSYEIKTAFGGIRSYISNCADRDSLEVFSKYHGG